MKWFILIFLFLSLLSVSLVSAQEYERYSVEADVHKETVSFTLEAIGDFSGETLFILPPGVKNLQTIMDSSSLLCFSEEIVGATQVSCFVPEGPHIVLFTFESAYPLVSLDGRALFSQTIDVETDYFLFTVALPKGYVVEDPRFLTPEPDRIYSDGQRIILSWDEQDYSGAFDVSVFMTPVAQEPSLLWYVVGSIVLVGLSVYIFFVRKKENLVKTFFSLPDILLDNEKKVLDALHKEGGVLWQKQVQIITGLSKVKLSRLLQSMEKRGLIRKEEYGTSNRIHLLQKEQK